MGVMTLKWWWGFLGAGPGRWEAQEAVGGGVGGERAAAALGGFVRCS